MSETPPATTSQDLEVSQVETEQNSVLRESDYEAIAAAVMETDRGRWFLQEYARRNRNADTQSVLTAIDKLEKRIGEEASAPKEATSIALLGHDLIDLAGAISQVKKEVSELGGQGADPDHFNTATVELEAIVEQTESATSEILEAAEKIQEVTWVLREEGASETQCDIIESKIVEVYTACSFQDLTGQRSNKVVQLVGYVERRVTSMMSILGLSDEEIQAAAGAPKSETEQTDAENSAPGLTPQQRNDERPDAELLNGPAMSGEGNEQGDVDALFGDVTFSEAPEFGSDTTALMDPDIAVPEADADELDDSGFDRLDLSPEDTSAAIDKDLEESVDIDLADVSADDIDGEEFAAIAPQDEATDTPSQAVENTQTTPTADFGKDDESANTPEAADIFGFDVYGDAQLVELHDAEILSQPAEEALLESALGKQTEQDIFDVDPLSFGGETIGADEDSELDDELEAETDGAPKMVVGLPGDFDVDSHVADMFVGSGDQTSQLEDTADLTTDNKHDLVDGQDIFEADCVDVDLVSNAANESDAELDADREVENVFADAMLAKTDDQEADDQAVDDQKQDVLESDGISAVETDSSVSEETAAGDEPQIQDQNLDQDEAEPVQTSVEALDMAAGDDAAAASQSNIEPQTEEPDPEPEPEQAFETAQTSAADDLMTQALAATSVAAEEADYPDDEYTAEERIALFS